MASLPVWRGSPLKPLWINTGSKVPAFASDPCSCCPGDGTGPPGGPFPSCANCIAHCHGINVSLSGFKSRTCTLFVYYSDTLTGPIIQTCTFDCLAGALNGSYSLTHEISRNALGACFSLDLSGGADCGGKLIGHQKCVNDDFHKPDPPEAYLYLKSLVACVACTSFGLCFNLTGSLCTVGGGVLGAVGIPTLQACDSFADGDGFSLACSGAPIAASNRINNCTDLLHGPTVSLPCKFLPYNVTARYRLA